MRISVGIVAERALLTSEKERSTGAIGYRRGQRPAVAGVTKAEGQSARTDSHGVRTRHEP